MTTKAVCTATSKRTGKRCGAYPSDGFYVCKWHGGGLPQVKRKAAERLAEQNLMKQHAGMKKRRVTNPLTTLQELAGEALAWKELCAEHVENLNNMLRYEGQGNTGEQTRAEVLLFEKAMDRCTNVLTAIAKLKIDERLVAIKEREADLFEKALMRTFAKMGLSDDQQSSARQIIAGEIRAISHSTGYAG